LIFQPGKPRLDSRLNRSVDEVATGMTKNRGHPGLDPENPPGKPVMQPMKVAWRSWRRSKV